MGKCCNHRKNMSRMKKRLPLSRSLGRSSNSVSKVNGFSATGYVKKGYFIGKKHSTHWQVHHNHTHLIIRIIILLKVRMGEGFLYAYPLVWVESQHLSQQVQCWGGRGGEKRGREGCKMHSPTQNSTPQNLAREA